MNLVELESVDRVAITILMDNVTDALLVDQDGISRINWPRAVHGALPTADARVSPDTGVPDALIAEPGFSALVRVTKGRHEHTLLFDTGVSPNGVVENMRRLGIPPGDIELIVLSHGHWDHVTGMEGLARALGRSSAAGDDPPGVLGPPARALPRPRPGRAARDQPRPRSRISASPSSRSASPRSCSTERC